MFVVMRGRMRHRGVGSVTNRLGSEWPLYEYDLALPVGLFLEHYVIHSRDLL